MASKILPTTSTTRNPASPFEAMVRETVRDEVRKALAAMAGPRYARLAACGLSPKQIPGLQREGVVFAKSSKYWIVDVASFEAYLERRRAERAERTPANDSERDALADLDPVVASAIRAAAGGR